MSADMSTAGSMTPATPAQIAVAVWEYMLAGISAGDRVSEITAARMSLLSQLDPVTPGTVAAQLVLVRKIMSNRLEVSIAGQRLNLYDDDGVTILQHWPLATTLGEPVVTSLGVQTKRGAPVTP
jgi:hypothetical protein